MKKLLSYLLILVAELSFFVPIATHRLIAKDEGFYLQAIKLVSNGKLPYIDFFYPQMPYLPYLYLPTELLAGFSWESARILSACFAALIGLLLYISIQNKQGKLIGIIALIVFSISNYTFPWLLTVKTYASSLFFLILAFSLARNFEKKSASDRQIFLAGVCLGISIGIRLTVAGLLPLFLLMLYLERACFKRVFTFLFGLSLSLIPVLIILILDYKSFYFNNLGYHLIRGTGDPDLTQRHQELIISILFGFKSNRSAEAIHMPILLWTSLLFFCWQSFKKKAPEFSLLFAGLLFVINLLPDPSYTQYFTTIIPFLVLYIFTTLPFNNKYLCGSFLAIFTLLHLPMLKSDLLKYTKTGEGVIGIITTANAKHWNIKNLKEISTKLNDFGYQKNVISTWPGFVYGTNLELATGLENHFAQLAIKKTSEAEQISYKLLSLKKAAQMISTRESPLLVLPTQQMNQPLFKRAIKAGNYKEVANIPPVIILTPQ